MLLQSSLSLPPPGFSTPQWSSLSEQWNAEFSPSKLITFTEPTTVILGHDDKESDDHLFESDEWRTHEFGWDCEHGKQTVVIKPFKIESLPVTNLEYLSYMKSNQITAIPASWVSSDGSSYFIRTLYGSVPFSIGQHWPLMASGEMLEAYAKWKGGRLPSEAELITLWKSDDGPRPAGREANVGSKRWHPVP
jgi:L-histidine Nalpha-methyltransferase / hercynylcysteine S-oxide synthase